MRRPLARIVSVLSWLGAAKAGYIRPRSGTTSDDNNSELRGKRLTAIAMVMMVIGYLVWPLVQ
jgi:hypothetical protein